MAKVVYCQSGFTLLLLVITKQKISSNSIWKFCVNFQHHSRGALIRLMTRPPSSIGVYDGICTCISCICCYHVYVGIKIIVLFLQFIEKQISWIVKTCLKSRSGVEDQMDNDGSFIPIQIQSFPQTLHVLSKMVPQKLFDIINSRLDHFADALQHKISSFIM